MIALIATNRPGAPALHPFTAPPDGDQPGGSGSGAAAAAAAAIEAEAGADAPPRKRQKRDAKGKEKAGKGKQKAGAADGGGKKQEAAERAAAGEASAAPPLADGPWGTLIVCPLSVLSNWQGQLEEHTSERLSGEPTHVCWEHRCSAGGAAGGSGLRCSAGVHAPSGAHPPPPLFTTCLPAPPPTVLVYHGPDRDRRVDFLAQHDVVGGVGWGGVFAGALALCLVAQCGMFANTKASLAGPCTQVITTYNILAQEAAARNGVGKVGGWAVAAAVVLDAAAGGGGEGCMAYVARVA